MASLDQISPNDHLVEGADPQVAQWPFMGSPVQVAVVYVTWLAFVLKLGPQMMRNRKPMELRNVIIAYNIFQILINVVLVYLALFYLPEVNVFCTPIGKPNIHKCHYLYFVVKMTDLIDTIFYVLRKKQNQVSFLNVYHHTLMFLAGWATCKYIPGGQLYFLGTINSFVHVVMYIYYLLTIWDESYKTKVWWKRHLTEMQIIQHCMVFTSFALALFNPSCTYPKMVLAGYLPLNIVMIHLFGKFYIKTYFKKDKPKEH